MVIARERSPIVEEWQVYRALPNYGQVESKDRERNRDGNDYQPDSSRHRDDGQSWIKRKRRESASGPGANP